jgi:hypothetical protein
MKPDTWTGPSGTEFVPTKNDQRGEWMCEGCCLFDDWSHVIARDCEAAANGEACDPPQKVLRRNDEP